MLALGLRERCRGHNQAGAMGLRCIRSQQCKCDPIRTRKHAIAVFVQDDDKVTRARLSIG